MFLCAIILTDNPARSYFSDVQSYIADVWWRWQQAVAYIPKLFPNFANVQSDEP
jgi:hypothetical protein